MPIFADANTAGRISQLNRQFGTPLGEQFNFCTPNGNNLPEKPPHPPLSHVKRRRRYVGKWQNRQGDEEEEMEEDCCRLNEFWRSFVPFYT